MKQKTIQIIFFILMITIYLTIFMFSAQNGKTSSGTSRQVVRQMIEWYPKSKQLTEKEKEEIVENMQPFIRKGAHFSIYALAGITTSGFLITITNKKKRQIGLTLSIGILYAISDEFHQSFSGGRTPSIIDVGIDSLGVMVGILIVQGLLFIKKTQKE